MWIVSSSTSPAARGLADSGGAVRAIWHPDQRPLAGVHQVSAPRPGSVGRSEIRVLFAFDPSRSALLLLGGDKAGNWQRWYRENIPIAEQLYLEYTTEQEE
jgi:hypothetical protein